MRSPAFFLVVSLAVIIAMGFNVGNVYLNGAQGNLTATDVAIFGLLAVFPFLLAALRAANAVVRTGSAPFPPNSRTFRSLVDLLIGGAVWAFVLLLMMTVSSA